MCTFYKLFDINARSSIEKIGVVSDLGSGFYKKEAILLLISASENDDSQKWIIRLDTFGKLYNYSMYYTNKTINLCNLWINIPMHKRYDGE